MSAPFGADQVRHRTGGADPNGVVGCRPGTAWPADYSLLGEPVEQGRGVNRKQSCHRNSAVGHDDLFPGAGPFDPTRESGPQSADGDFHFRSVDLWQYLLYVPTGPFGDMSVDRRIDRDAPPPGPAGIVRQ
jgi:hypothetical protein